MFDFRVIYDIPAGEITWPMYIALYIYFTGMSAGSFVLSTLGNIFGMKKFKPIGRIGVVLATVLLMLAPLFLILDLDQPLRAYTTLYRTNLSSPMSWGVYLLTLYPMNCIIYAWFQFRADFVRLSEEARSVGKKGFYALLALGIMDLSAKALSRDKKMAKVFGIIGIPLAIMVHGYTGVLLSVVGTWDLWHTSLMPLLFLVSAVASGVGLFTILVYIFQRFFSASRKVNAVLLYDLVKLMAMMIIVDITFIISELIVLGYGGTEGWEIFWVLTMGPLSPTFVGVELIVGGFLPVALVLYPKTGRSPAGQLTAAVLVLFGILMMRYNVILGGQMVPIRGWEMPYYHMTPAEVLSIVGVILLGTLLLYTAFRILPMEPLRHGAGGKSGDRHPGAGNGAVLAETGPAGRREFLRNGLTASLALLFGLSVPPALARTASAAPPAFEPSYEDSGKKRYAMVIDLRKCIGCHSCTQACKREFNIPAGKWRSWVSKVKKGDKHHFLPRLCNHCERPPCVRICPVRATYKAEGGFILQRYDKCIGCKYCVVTCPYGMRFVHPKMKVVDKCTFCYHRVKKGLLPACVMACPVQARIFGDLHDPDSEVRRILDSTPSQVLKPDKNTRPMVYYINGDVSVMQAGIDK